MRSPPASDHDSRFPPDIISHAVGLSHRFCRSVMPSVVHVTDQDANTRAEVSHHPTRPRERQMRRFTSAAQLQRVASAHHRLLRTRAVVEWDAVTCAC